MKVYIKHILVVFIFTLSSIVLKAQCPTEGCITKLSDEYLLLKYFKIEIPGNEVEYSYVFSKNTNYLLVTCNKEEASNVVVSLFDSNKKLIASNYDPSTEKYYASLAYNCNTTGIYYLKYSFKDNPECCVSVLGFKK